MAFNWGGAFRGGAGGATAGATVGGPWGAAIGGGIGALTGGFSGNNDEKTNKLLDQIPDELKKYLMPYIQNGQQAGSHLNDISSEYEKNYQDPNSIIARIGAGYKQSPGYKWRLEQGENEINNAQAASGMAGSAQHQQRAGELAGHLADQDYQDYVSQALGLRREGLTGRTGLEQDIYGKGYSASGDLATGLANVLKTKAGLNYQKGSQDNALNSDTLSSILAYLQKNPQALSALKQ